MVLILISLGMLFFVSILGYVLIRVGSAKSPPLGAISVPMGLWRSTAVVMAGSFTIHLAVRDVRRERQAGLRQWLLATLVIALIFVALQLIFLRQLLAIHIEQQSHAFPDTVPVFTQAGIVCRRERSGGLRQRCARMPQKIFLLPPFGAAQP